MKIRTFIVEDSKVHLENLINHLKTYSQDIEIIGHASSIIDAKKEIIRLEPALLFLDIELHPGTSFDLLVQLANEGYQNFHIIFVTAYGTFDYAKKAIEFSAIEYIMKPIDPEKLIKAINSVKVEIEHEKEFKRLKFLLDEVKNENVNNLQSHEFTKEILIDELNNNQTRVTISKIKYFEVTQNCTKFYLQGETKSITSRRPMKVFEKILSGECYFFKISRYQIVNLMNIKSINKSRKTLILLTGEVLNISRRRTQDCYDRWQSAIKKLDV